MADLTVTAAKVGAIFGIQALIIDVEAGATITRGQACYIDTNGQAQLADASVAGTAQARGIALKDVGSGDTVPLLVRGGLEGVDVSSMNGDAPIYVSDTAGALADAAGTVSKQVGVVMVVPGTSTKVAFIDVPWNT